MPEYCTHSHWLARYQAVPTTPDPVFSGWTAEAPEGMPTVLRSAFAFLRRHANGRYTAQSLMKLLAAADRLDEALAGGFNVLASDLPAVALAVLPYAYDEDTEVKTGGVVGAAVVLPDGRMMMAVNKDMRRTRVGLALYRYVVNYLRTNPVVWIHQDNMTGAQFALAAGMVPREVNSRGAVAYSENVVYQDEDNIASPCTDDWEIEDALASSRPGRARPRRRSVGLADMPPSAPCPPRYAALEYDGEERDEVYDYDDTRTVRC